MPIRYRNLNFASVVAGGIHFGAQSTKGRVGATSALARSVGVGAGFEPAKGVHRDDAPAPESRQIGSFVKTTAATLVNGVQHMAQELADRRIPTIMASFCKQPDGSVQATAATPA